MSYRSDPETEVDRVEPSAPALMESMRAFGYNVQTSLADLVDNSISARAHNVWITLFWNGPDSWISVRDDGEGMSEAGLIEAMRPGTRNPLAPRDKSDLGRFGLGLKTASLAQCRCLTVLTQSEQNRSFVRRWDLDYVQESRDWLLLRSPRPGSENRLALPTGSGPGTIVLWECMDHLVGAEPVQDERAQDRFLQLAEDIEQHLAMTYHRYLERSDRLQIHLNGRRIRPWDPFLVREAATQLLAEESLALLGDSIEVRPYVLPHHSKVDPETYKRVEGPRGWTAQQGFYVYRNERLLVAGDWLGLGFRKDPDCRLARIQLDIPNTMDGSWQIDVRKATARPPAVLRNGLRRLARLTRIRAVSVYRHRGKLIARENAAKHIYLWQKNVRHGKTFYGVNRDHPSVVETRAGRLSVDALLRLIEETVPVPMIGVDSAAAPESHAEPFEGAASDELKVVLEQVFRALIRGGATPAEAAARVSVLEPFNRYPDLVSALNVADGLA